MRKLRLPHLYFTIFALFYLNASLKGCPCTGKVTKDSPAFFSDEFYQPPVTEADSAELDLISTGTHPS